MSDVYLDSDYRTESDAGNDTRTVHGPERVAQQIGVLVQRVLNQEGAIPKTANEVAKLEGSIADVVTLANDVQSVNSVIVTDTGEESLSITVDTDIVTVEDTFGLSRPT